MTVKLPFHFTPGKLIVFEGLDDTGKSTQLERFAQACHMPSMGTPIWEPTPMFTHQPSGATGLGPEIYDLTESVDWSIGSPVTRQLLHLAAHAEHYEHDIIPALATGSVIMDRCWWSTYAYGYRDYIRQYYSQEDYIALCKLPAQSINPDLIVLFTHRYGEKSSRARTSSDRTTFRNYMDLQDRYRDITIVVPNQDPGRVNAFISGALYERGFVTNGKG